jgi:hypothetical protein
MEEKQFNEILSYVEAGDSIEGAIKRAGVALSTARRKMTKQQSLTLKGIKLIKTNTDSVRNIPPNILDIL